MGSADEIKQALEKLTSAVEKMREAQEMMQASLDKLAPIAPVVDQLPAIPSKVLSLQASAYENREQISALNLALIRAEKSHRDGKAAATDEGDTSVGNPPKPGLPRDHTRPPPEKPRDGRGDEDAYDDSRFHSRVRLEFPTFDGKDDPLPWLNRCETFRGQGTPEPRRVWYAAMHLTGAAQLWYARLELTSGTSSWRRFAQLVQQRFGPPMTESPVGELVLLRRTGSVDEYTDQFLRFACRDPDLTEMQLVHIYTAGLVNPLKTDVALRRPTSLDDAIMLARAYEQRQQLSLSDPVPGRGNRAAQQSPAATTAKSAAGAASTSSTAPGSSRSAAASPSCCRAAA
jgi:hypothetical protein